MSVKINKKIYNKFSKEYHKELLRENYWHRYIEKPAISSLLRDIVKNKKVLDLGCGSGIFSNEISTRWRAEVTGIDLSNGLIKIAEENYPKINFFVGNAQKTPFKDNSFDVITSSLMIHYFKNLRPLFKEVSRILKRRGIFVFSMHHPIKEVIHKLNIKRIKGSLFTSYFNNDKYIWTLHNRLTLVSYHHTFEAIIEALYETGFYIERLLEPVSLKAGKKKNKKMYERSINRPTFLVIRAVKR